MGIGIAFVLLGVFVLTATCFRWDWFLSHFKVRDVFKILGNTGATIFYVVLSLVFIVIGLLIVTGAVKLS